MITKYYDDIGQEITSRMWAAKARFERSGVFASNTLFIKDLTRLHAGGSLAYWTVVCGKCHQSYTSTSNILNTGFTQCLCTIENRAADLVTVQRIRQTGMFAPRTKFKRLGVTGSLWAVTCTACKESYTSPLSNLIMGKQGCLCGHEKAAARRIPKPEKPVPLKLPRKLKGEDEFIKGFYGAGWPKETKFKMVGREPGGKVIWEITCDDCGETWESQTANLMNRHKGCSCASPIDKAYINLLTDGETPVGVKFGIAVDADVRRRVQQRRTQLSIETLVVYRFPSVSKCRVAEQHCREKFECGIIPKSDMPDGWTETTYCYNIEAIEAIYRKHGGVRI